MKTLTLGKDIEGNLQDLISHSASLEQQNSALKRVIRILSEGMALDENGDQQIQLTQEQADYIKKVCDETNVFLLV